MRIYEETHKWITFEADYKKASYELWTILGECQSKCEHISNVALKPETTKELQLVFLAKGVAGSAAIEGNTLTEEQVKLHLEGKLELPASQRYLQREIDNIIKGCNIFIDEMRSGTVPVLSKERIKQLNKIVLDGCPLDDEKIIPGEIRKHDIGVMRYRGAPWADCDYLVDRLCEWLNGDAFTPQPGQEIVFSTLKAILAHLYIAWIHPFGDGNGRTARLVELQILITSGVPAPAAHLLSNHYNKTRNEYYRQLDRASQSGGDVIPFTLYAAAGFRDGLKEQLNRIFLQQLETTWQNYVYERFRSRHSLSDDRRRNLVFDLTSQPGPVLRENIPSISARIAAEYAKKTPKTLARDLNELIAMELIRKTPEGYRPNVEVLRGMFPVHARSG